MTKPIILTIDDVEEHIIKTALRYYRYFLSAEREAMVEADDNDPYNPEWVNNEEWIERTVYLERYVAKPELQVISKKEV